MVLLIVHECLRTVLGSVEVKDHSVYTPLLLHLYQTIIRISTRAIDNDRTGAIRFMKLVSTWMDGTYGQKLLELSAS